MQLSRLYLGNILEIFELEADMKIILVGSTGRMGRAITARAAEFSCEIYPLGKSDDISKLQGDVIIDFSSLEGCKTAISISSKLKIPLVVGTTGLTDELLESLDQLSKVVPVLVAANTSVGVTALLSLVENAAKLLGKDWNVEISEIHHTKKVDSPSGTALALLDAVNSGRGEMPVVHGRSGHVGARPKNEIGMHAIRGGSVIGEHTVYFFSEGERIEITHQAQNRDIFADGSIQAAKWLAAKGRANGMYKMKDVIQG